MVKKNKTNFNKKFIIISVVILVLALIIIGLLIKNKSSLTGEVISGNVIGITGNVVQGGECDECRRNNDCLKGYICDIQMINGEPVYDKPRKCFLGNCKFDEDCIKIGKNTCVDHKCE